MFVVQAAEAFGRNVLQRRFVNNADIVFEESDRLSNRARFDTTDEHR
jgi:hypothetical protein